MKPLDLWRHEARRAGLPALLGPPVLAVLILLLTLFGTRLGARVENTDRFALLALEAGIPLLAGVAAAALPGDPLSELRLTVPRGYRAAVLRRLAVMLGVAALSALTVSVVLMATGRWWFGHTGPTGQLLWLSPMLWLATLGLLTAAALRGTAAATSVVGAVWTVELGGLLSGHGWHRFFTTSAWPADPAGWPVSRLVLLSTAVPLAVGAWLLLGNAERVLGGDPE